MHNKPPFMKSDLESGTTGTLYPTMTESPQLQWLFIRKVYSIIAIRDTGSTILTAMVVGSLTLFKFWAAKMGYDFKFLGPFLFSAYGVLVFAPVQIFFPLGKLSVMIYGCLAALISCGYIVYDTDDLIKRYTYDEFIWVAIALYLDILNFFMVLLTIFTLLTVDMLILGRVVLLEYMNTRNTHI
ncbi:hypothetical protein Hdeb2414_s0009g00321011 [Helianthus debilis subsp. tardiflorus]